MYMLWDVTPQGHLTYNAILFTKILHDVGLHYHGALTILMLFEVGILMLGANTGFLGGPAVLANMAADRWVPNLFRNLSSRLVKQNGILAFGIAAGVITLMTQGHVRTLVVLYSITVFLAFALTLFALTWHWWRDRHNWPWYKWTGKCIQAGLGTFICLVILGIMVVEKFDQGAFLTVVILLFMCFVAWRIRVHYRYYRRTLLTIDRTLSIKPSQVTPKTEVQLKDHTGATAVIYVNEHPGLGMHTLLWLFRLFPNHFTHFIFIQAGSVDIESFLGAEELKEMQKKVAKNLAYFVETVHAMGYEAERYLGMAQPQLLS